MSNKVKEEIDQQKPSAISGLRFAIGRTIIGIGASVAGKFLLQYSNGNMRMVNRTDISRPIDGHWITGANGEPLFYRSKSDRKFNFLGSETGLIYKSFDELVDPGDVKIIEQINKNEEKFRDEDDGIVKVPNSDMINLDITEKFKAFDLDPNLGRRMMSDAIERREATLDKDTIKDALIKASFFMMGAIVMYMGTTAGSGSGGVSSGLIGMITMPTLGF